MSVDFLPLELRLIVAKYGYSAVAEALAALGEKPKLSAEEEIRELEASLKSPKRKPERPVSETIEAYTDGNPEVRARLEQLAKLYEEKAFLPELRDVNRFLEREGRRHSRGPRRVAIHEVMRVLSNKSVEDLDLKIEHVEIGDLGIIAKAIMTSDRSPAPPRATPTRPEYSNPTDTNRP